MKHSLGASGAPGGIPTELCAEVLEHTLWAVTQGGALVSADNLTNLRNYGVVIKTHTTHWRAVLTTSQFSWLWRWIPLAPLLICLHPCIIN